MYDEKRGHAAEMISEEAINMKACRIDPSSLSGEELEGNEERAMRGALRSAMMAQESAVKRCPVCHALCFADMDTCYGCLHSFAGDGSESIKTDIEGSTGISIKRSAGGNVEGFTKTDDERPVGLGAEAPATTDAGRLARANEEGLTKTETKACRSTDGGEEIKAPPVSMETQTALTDLFEIVISVRASQQTAKQTNQRPAR